MKNRAIIYILIGALLLILGLIFVYDDMIGIGVLLIGAAGALIFPGFFMLFSDNEDEKKAQKLTSPRSSASPPIGSTMAVIDITFSYTETAISTDSIYICQKATAQLDYFFYLFFINYIIICSTNNEQFVMTYANLFIQKLKDYFSGKIAKSKIEQIINDRIAEYDKIMADSENPLQELQFAVEQHLVKDIWFLNSADESIDIIGIDKQLEIRSEIENISEHVFDQTESHYKTLYERWSNLS